MGENIILKKVGILMFVPNCYNNQKMCNKAVDNCAHALFNAAINMYPYAIQFVPECHNIQEICDKAVDTCPFVSDSVPDQYKISCFQRTFYAKILL